MRKQEVVIGPVDDGVGECVIVWYEDLAELYPKFHIERADPKVWITSKLIDEIRRGPHHPDVDLDGDLLRIRAVNRTVTYRLLDYDQESDRYLAEWAD